MWPQLIYSPTELVSAWLRGTRLSVDWPELSGGQVMLTHLSRVAIVAAWERLGLAPGDEVLVPSYNCGSEISPLIWCGAKVVPYGVALSTEIDFEDLKGRVTTKTKAVYVTHYFGWAQPMHELAAWCRERGLFLIEDCAMSLFSSGGQGTHGDASIICFWKSLPLPDGGALVMRDARSPDSKTTGPNLRSTLRLTKPILRRWAKSVARRALGERYDRLKGLRSRQHGSPSPSPSVGHPDMPADYYFDARMKNLTMLRTSVGLINASDRADILAIRRRNYARLQAGIEGIAGMRCLFEELPSEVCPLVMPVLVDNRDRWHQELVRQGEFSMAWWRGYHREVNIDAFADACRLKDQVLAFHIDQNVGDDDIDRLIRKLELVATSA